MTNRYDSEATINDILNVATALFLEKGYEKTSIQDIVNGLDGLTRGAIYHHFDNKDAIIKAVTRRLFLQDEYFESLEMRDDLNGQEKLQVALMDTIMSEDVQKYASSGYALLKNPRFYLEYMKVNAEVISPQVEKLIELGNKDGSMSVKYPKYVAEVIVLLLTGWYVSAIYPVSVEEFFDKLEATQHIFESIGVSVFSDEFLKTLKEYERESK